jgi:hypothetical protein
VVDKPIFDEVRERFRESACALSVAAEKLLFNIGPIPVRQSRLLGFPCRQTANLAAGHKIASRPAASRPAEPPLNH